MIRKATIQDSSRIAEILVFTKRVNYRSIFHDDKVSFGEMQVYPLAKQYIEDPSKLANIWVYDDEFVKGLIHIENQRIAELYVDSFFENNGIGKKLIEFAVQEKECNCVWVLEKNHDAIRFYERHGFKKTGEKELRIRSYSTPLRQDDGSEVDQDEVTDVSKIADPGCDWMSVRLPEHVSDLDKRWFLCHAKRFIDEYAKDELGGKNCSEKRIIVAAMLYVYAHKVPRQRLIVEKLLHVKHVGAKKKIDKMIERLRKYCKKNDIRMCDQAFVGALIESANRILKDHLPTLQAESKI